ncbi:MAG: TetR/AcrR family transcriptional regulator [Marinobacter sp.]|uniref:TetR/AcrR family transcriptional regulator n=1 Tax=Marinobacter sp. TaxID=50741 RepID=UPI00299CEFF5|nr:TetR/AcrR family transcriptional regulator [Marinobacter sp.]MDX1635460.1 TetR/AcrR family transcriptional regulator [Marinobacter sp.]
MATSDRNKDDKTYHHGNLRAVLIDAGLAILEEGEQELTLRSVAKRVGVSHTAPYNHFAGKDGLLAEIAIRGFEELRRVTDEARLAAGSDADDQLLATGLAYIRFGSRRPALYQLMFGPRKAGVSSEKVEAAGAAAFEVLVEVIRGGVGSGRFRQVDIRGAAFSSWALVHGMTQMVLDRTGAPGADKGTDIEMRLLAAHSITMKGLLKS